MCQQNVDDPGEIPAELQGLWYMERHAIARQNAIIRIITLGGGQGGSQGHSIVLDNPNASNLFVRLPREPDPNEVVVVTLEGCKKRLARKNRSIRPAKVKAALLWLKKHNPRYADIVIDYDLLHRWEAAAN